MSLFDDRSRSAIDILGLGRGSFEFCGFSVFKDRRTASVKTCSRFKVVRVSSSFLAAIFSSKTPPNHHKKLKEKKRVIEIIRYNLVLDLFAIIWVCLLGWGLG